ncbi:MAG: S1 RNA-binding domain-containing protein [Clostridia bacterium]|nr:S1 RNA-binding domain-containing protein [Clostridia bacterium]
MAVEVGSVVTGKVVRVMPFGAFVQIGEKVTGLVHISEISRTYVENINDHIKVGDEVSAVVVKVEDNGKISLSIKKALASKPREQKKKEPIRPADVDWGKKNNVDMSFEDRLSKFKMDSDENMAALRRSADSKRSGGYKRGR